MSAKGTYFLLTDVAFFTLAIGLFAYYLLKKVGFKVAMLGASNGVKGDKASKKDVFVFFVRLAILVFSITLGGSIGGVAYDMPYSFRWPSFDLGVIGSNLMWGFCFGWLWPILVPTLLWGIMCLFPRCPWWGFAFAFIGSGLLAYGASYSWYTP